MNDPGITNQNKRETLYQSIEIVILFILVINFILTLQTANTPLAILLNFITILIVGSYIVVSTTNFKKKKNIDIKFIKNLILFFLIFFIIITTLLSQIYYKEANLKLVTYHDGARQTETAFDFLQSGKNPYSETYYNTDLEKFVKYIYTNEQYYLNPALEHYIYLPATFIISGSFNAVQKVVTGWTDLRILNFLYLMGALLLLWKIIGQHPLRNLLIILFTLNPFWLRFFIEGRNDIIVLFWIIATFYLLQKNKYIFAGLTFGIALSTKQFTWIFIPFILVYLLKANRLPDKITIKKITKFLLPAFLLAILFILPFAIWDWHSFLDDTIRYASGTSQGLNYPITGYGFSRIVTLLGFHSQSAFPFWIPVLIIGLPLMILLLKRVWRQGTLTSVILNTTLFLLLVFLFSRFFNDSYLALISQLLIFWLAFVLSNYKKTHKISI